MSTIDKTEMGAWLCAYLDGALSSDERTLVERLLSENADARALLDVLRDTSEAVRELPRHPAPDTILEDIRNRLERSELIGDEPELAPSSAKGSSALSRWAIAATLGFAAVGGMWAVVDRFGPNRPTQVASAPEARDGFDAIKKIASKSQAKRETPANQAAKPKTMHKDRSEEPPKRGAEKRRARRGSSNEDRPTFAGSKEKPATPESRVAANHPVSVASVTPLQPIDAPMLERLILGNRKLGQAWPKTAILRHRFERETVRLSFDSPDEFARNRLTRSLIRHLQAATAIDLKERRQQTKTSPFYLEGVAGVNFDSRKTRQILLRLPKNRATQVLGGLLSDASRPYTSVKLNVDSFSVDGRDGIRSMLASLSPKTDAVKAALPTAHASPEPAKSERKAGDVSTGPSGNMFAGLFRVIGIDPSTLSPPASPRAEQEKPSKGLTSADADADATTPPPDAPRANDTPATGNEGAPAQKVSPSVVVAESVLRDSEVEPTESSLKPSKRRSLVEKRMDALRRPTLTKEGDKKADSPAGLSHNSRSTIVERKASSKDAPQEWITIIVELNLPETRPSKPNPPKLLPKDRPATMGPVAPKPGAQSKPSSGAKPKK